MVQYGDGASAAVLQNIHIRAGALDYVAKSQGATVEQIEKAAKAMPLRKVGRPQDVANAVVFLASDAARYITATALVVDAGLTQKTT